MSYRVKREEFPNLFSGLSFKAFSAVTSLSPFVSSWRVVSPHDIALPNK